MGGAAIVGRMPVAVDPEKHKDIAERRQSGRRWSDGMLDLQFGHLTETLAILGRLPDAIGKVDDKVDDVQEKLRGDVSLVATAVTELKQELATTRKLCEGIKADNEAKAERRGRVVLAVIAGWFSLMVAIVGAAATIYAAGA